MKPISENLALLLCSDKALTIQKTDEGFIIAFSDLEGDDESLIFVPEKIMHATKSLEESLDIFYAHHQMTQVRGFQA